MNKSKKRNIIIGSLCAVVLLMAVGYAAFQTVLNIEGTSTISGNWDIKITNVSSKNIKGTASNNGDPTWENLTATFKTNLQSPGDSIEYDITVTNNGNLNAKLDKYKLTDTNNEVIKFTQIGLTNGEVLTAGSTKTFTVKVEYLSTTSEQPSKVTSALTITLDYSQAENGYIPSDQTAAEQLTSNLVTSGNGLYVSDYEGGRYIYKGKNPNNYIKFNNEIWRIVTIEQDNTLKIIRDEKLPTEMAYDERTSETSGHRLNSNNTYCTLASDGIYYGCNAWFKVNGIFINGDYSGTVTEDASLNTYLNTVYINSLNDKSKNFIQRHSFNIGSTLNNLIASSIINNEYATQWVGDIALLSIGEFIQSSSNPNCISTSNPNQSNNPCMFDNYLHKKYEWWLLNPHASGNEGTPRDYYSENSSWVGGGYSYMAYGVRPALYLNSNITLSGEGTISNPYTIN